MESIWFFDQLADLRITGAQTAGKYDLVEIWGPPGTQTPLHVHHEEAEGFAVLEGEATFWVGDTSFTLRAGEFAEAPPAVPHCWQNTGDGDVRMMAVTTPAGFADFVRELGTAAPARELPVLDGPPDLERVVRIAAAHGIEILGPPGMRPSDLAAAARP
jgi:mannose-6-phosphate isomerase-like protein (cupin superfamily)